MKRKKIIKKIDEYLKKYGLSMTKERMTMFDDLLIAIFRLGMKEGVKESEEQLAKNWLSLIKDNKLDDFTPAEDWEKALSNIEADNGEHCRFDKKCSSKLCRFFSLTNPKHYFECFFFKELKTNKSGGHPENPDYCLSKAWCPPLRPCCNTTDNTFCGFDVREKQNKSGGHVENPDHCRYKNECPVWNCETCDFDTR